MIESFKCKETEKLFQRQLSKRLPQSIQKVAMRKLWMLDAAVQLGDLRVPPNNKLEALKGDRKGQYSIRINQQWRICFVWNAGNATQVEIVDYH
ncbi:MAG: type II toxin-antitoxin system RelE/ParE family toxin [Kiritimatiellales bacterium]|nr:type II toxin-antitoxin system RelE/ParE family toxin [Kiritimatiellales bacterium]MCF7864390.1 type II toxin-antitoxin system RelE/ParE family toxin [Kiritimatiellales bacterium]